MRNRPPTTPFPREHRGAAAKPGEEPWRERIARAFERMSASNRKVASFLIEHPTEAAFMTGSQLAYHLDLDPATIVRFAQSLGYPGYPELSSDVQTSVRAIFDVAHEVKEVSSGTQAGAWQNGLLASAGVVQSMAGVIIWKDARKFLKLLRDAQSVMVVGEAADRILAEWFTHNLRTAGLRAMTIDADPRACAALVDTIHDGDLLVGVAITTQGTATAEVLKAGVERGGRAIALATGASEPAGLASEVTLTCPVGDSAGSENRLASVSFAAIVESLRRALTASAQGEE